MPEAAAIPADAPLPAPAAVAPIEHAPLKVGVAALLVLLADQLFFSHKPGVSVSLFLLAIVAGALFVNRDRTPLLQQMLGVAIGLAGALPMAVEASIPGFLSAVIAAGLAAIVLSGQAERTWRGLLRQFAWLGLLGPFQILRDAADAPRMGSVEKMRAGGRNLVLVWAVPAVFGLAFLWLFAEANPLVADLVNQLEWLIVRDLMNPQRMTFWLVMLGFVWPLVHVRTRRSKAKAANGVADSASLSFADSFLSDASILRALILFNLLFAAQSAMDFAYLVNGFALPKGMTYAAYAHRGAYPLVVTALLAAVFVLVTLREGGTAEKSPLLRGLLLVFMAQNILLVLSSVYRLKLYVEIYSLTLLRVSAFIWMGLVILGLALIIVRMLQRRSNGWLVGVNLAALALTLYACCFVNFATLIGNYNVAHERTIGQVDVNYIASFGAQAIPVLDRYIARFPEGVSDPQRDRAIHRRNMRAKYFLQGSTPDWRSWTLRDHRIRSYLDAKPVIASGYTLDFRTN
jgi:Domain of unknown function (DUF4173)